MSERVTTGRESGKISPEIFTRSLASYKPGGILKGWLVEELAVLIPLHTSLLTYPCLVFHYFLLSFLPFLSLGPLFPRASTFPPH